MNGHWEHFPHGADIGVRGVGASVAEAFEQAALALTAVMTDPLSVAQREEVAISCEAPDLELLLVDWLNAIVYEMATRHLVFGRYEASLSGQKLAGRAWGEPVDVPRHQPAVEVKAASMAELCVRQTSDGWIAQCVLDV